MRLLVGAAALVVVLSGCTADFVPEMPQARDCAHAQPRSGPLAADDGDGADLVPTDSQPVAITVCNFPLNAPDGSAPTARAYSGDEVRAAVEELNGFPPLQHPEDLECSKPAWPGYVLLVEHTDGTVTALSADRSCGLVSDGSGAVRIGTPALIAGA
jgi:hypothetical protein